MKKDFIIYFSSNVISKIIVGIAGIIVARFLTKEDFGFLKSVLAFLGLVGIFLNFGLSDLYLLEKSKQKAKDLLNKVIGNYLLIYLVVFPFSLGLYFILFSKNLFIFFVLYLKMFIDWLNGIITLTLQAKNLFIVISKILLLSAFISLLPVGYLYFIGNNLNLYVLMMIISSISIFVINKSFSKKIIDFTINLKFKPDFSLLKLSSPFFVSALMSYIYMQSDILMLSIMKGNIEVSRYAVVTSIIFAAYMLPSIIYHYFFPKLANVIHSSDLVKVRNILINFFFLVSIIVIPFSLICFFESRNILSFIYTAKYIDSYFIFKILIIVFLFHSFVFISAAILTASGNQKLRSKFQIYAALLNIVLNLILIPKYNAEGAAIATAITEVLLFILYFIFTVKILKEKNV